LPLSEKVRVEVYIPDLPVQAYQDLLETLEQEFTHTFGGVTVIRGLRGSYLSRLGLTMRDRVDLIYSDIPLSLATDRELISRYGDYIREAASVALEEEAVLAVVQTVYHAE
jgi:hypothetical protein